MAGLLDALQGGLFGASPYADLLDEKQRQQINQRSMMAMAAKLLAAGGPSTTRTTMGQALGGAYGAGLEAQQEASKDALTGMLTRQKIDEYRRDLALKDKWQKMMTGAQPGAAAAPMTSADALAAPVTQALPAGPTVARANMIGQAPAAVPGTPQSILTNLSPEQRALMAMMGYEKGGAKLLDIAGQQAEYGEPKPFMKQDGTIGMMQYNKLGQSREVKGLQPYEALPTDVRAVEYLTGQKLGGGGQPAMSQVGAYRETISPKTKIENKFPEAFATSAAGQATGRLEGMYGTAQSANATLQTIDRIAPAIDKAILGPGADYRTTLYRIGQTLGYTGNESDVLQRTAQVVQGLAQNELTAAQAMKGQGQITEGERALLRKASTGDQSLTGPELKTVMGVMQKVAQQRQKDYLDMYGRAQRIQGFGSMAPMYEFTPYTSQYDLSGNVIGNLIQQNLNRRAGQR